MRYFINLKNGELNEASSVLDIADSTRMVRENPHCNMEVSERQYNDIVFFQSQYVKQINNYLA